MEEPRIEEKLIKHLVDRFLGWKLPADFYPDAGITFKPTFNDTPEVMQALGLTEPMRHEPIGTNLFTAEQAEEMFRFLLENDDGTSIVSELITQAHQAGIDEAVERVLKIIDEQKYREKAINGEFVEMECDINSTIFIIENKLKEALQDNK